MIKIDYTIIGQCDSFKCRRIQSDSYLMYKVFIDQDIVKPGVYPLLGIIVHEFTCN